MSAPRVRCEHRDRDEFLGIYKGHAVDISRHGAGQPWYMAVKAPDGTMACDGWIRDTGFTQREAIIHALKGALLYTP